MISPTAEYSRVLFGVLLLAVVALFVLRAVRKDRDEYQRFKSLTRTEDRQRTFRKWLGQSAAVFGGGAAVLLALLWQHVGLFQRAVDAVPLVRGFRRWFADTGDLGDGIVIGLAVAIVGGTVLAVFAARNTTEVLAVGDITALLPRNRVELGYGAALSVNAGVSEELMFRLALPTLVFAVTRNPAVAIVTAVVIFALLHLYQGVAGIIGSAVIGALLTAVFVASGSIVAAMTVHALIDLRSLVLIPLFVNRVWKTHAAAPIPAPSQDSNSPVSDGHSAAEL